MDPTDPKKNSEGAEAFLFRYYFLNNTNLWLWAIEPNNNVRTDIVNNLRTDGYEFGGRFQYPFKYCEGALTYHNKKINSMDFDSENRFGLDLRWDFEIGLWIPLTF